MSIRQKRSPNSWMPFVRTISVWCNHFLLSIFMSHYCITCDCLETKSLETNFMYIFSSESGKSWMIMLWFSQTGTEADDTAIIWSLRCSIDSLSTHTLCLSVTDGESRLLKLKKYACTHWRPHTDTHTHTHTHKNTNKQKKTKNTFKYLETP